MAVLEISGYFLIAWQITYDCQLFEETVSNIDFKNTFSTKTILD